MSNIILHCLVCSFAWTLVQWITQWRNVNNLREESEARDKIFRGWGLKIWGPGADGHCSVKCAGNALGMGTVTGMRRRRGQDLGWGWQWLPSLCRSIMWNFWLKYTPFKNVNHSDWPAWVWLYKMQCRVKLIMAALCANREKSISNRQRLH